MVKGEARTVRVHVPASYKAASPTPLVLNFHGYTSSATEQETWSKMIEKSDKEGFIVLHPQGTGLLKGWNAGACCGDAQTKKVDDVGFTKAMLDEAEKRFCIDTKRVYSAGMSNGGFMSYRLACEMSDRIAAIAPVAGLSTVAPCTPGRPVPVMHFHGTADNVVPYNGGGLAGYPKAADSIAAWAAINQCTGAPVETFNKGDARCVTHKTCAGGAEVTFCTLTGGGHTWPGGTPVPILGTTNKDISATDAMWDFFKAHPLP
jgi:polyhydroxybutyrate depolymerase